MVPRTAKLAELREYRRIASIDEIGRRCLANNSFDGILTMIGVLMGSFISGITEPRIVLSTGLATCLAMGISGFSGAYVTEAAERKKVLRELEQAMLRDLNDTKQARASRFAVIVVSLIDGLSPLLSGITVILPFAFTGLWGNVNISYGISVGIAMLGLFGLGVFLAQVAKENILISGGRMVIVGVICIALSLLLNGGSPQ